MAKQTSINQTKYDKAHCRTYGLKLNLATDADIIARLAAVPSMQGYIKQLIRQDIAGSVPVPVPDKQMTLDELYTFLQGQTAAFDGSMYELLNALTNKHMNS